MRNLHRWIFITNTALPRDFVLINPVRRNSPPVRFTVRFLCQHRPKPRGNLEAHHRRSSSHHHHEHRHVSRPSTGSHTCSWSLLQGRRGRQEGHHREVRRGHLQEGRRPRSVEDPVTQQSDSQSVSSQVLVATRRYSRELLDVNMRKARPFVRGGPSKTG